MLRDVSAKRKATPSRDPKAEQKVCPSFKNNSVFAISSRARVHAFDCDSCNELPKSREYLCAQIPYQSRNLQISDDSFMKLTSFESTERAFVVLRHSHTHFRRLDSDRPYLALRPSLVQALFCIEIFKLRSTFVTTSYKSPTVVVWSLSFPFRQLTLQVYWTQCRFREQKQEVALCRSRRFFLQLLQKTTGN